MSYKITGTKIELTRGDSFYCLIMISKDGSPYEPQEGDVIRFAMKKGTMTSLKDSYISRTPLILKTIPNDTLVLSIEPDDTKNLKFGQYVYDIEITFANGDVDTFINNAVFELLPEVL